MNLAFVNQNEEDSNYPLTIRGIAEAQEYNPDIVTQAGTEGCSTQLVEDVSVLCKGKKMVIPKACNIAQYVGTTTTFCTL
jgi:hypothetical protein